MYHTPVGFFAPPYLYLQPDQHATPLQIMDHFLATKKEEAAAAAAVVKEEPSEEASTVVMPSMEEQLSPSDSGKDGDNSQPQFLHNNQMELCEQDLITLKKHALSHHRRSGKRRSNDDAAEDKINPAAHIVCPQCAFRTTTKQNLRNHTLRKHTDKDLIEWLRCPYCDYKTVDKSNFRKHVKRHTSMVMPNDSKPKQRRRSPKKKSSNETTDGDGLSLEINMNN